MCLAHLTNATGKHELVDGPPARQVNLQAITPMLHIHVVNSNKVL